MTVVDYLRSANSESFVVDAILGGADLCARLDDDAKVSAYAGALYNYFMKECVLAHQYIAFTDSDHALIRSIYLDLARKLASSRWKPRASVVGGNDEADGARAAVAAIVRAHRERLVALLASKGDAAAATASCAEYSPEFQAAMLRIDLRALPGPVLDVGCGREAALVRALRAEGADAYGMDQYESAEPFVFRKSWFDFRFAEAAWGTIVAHMSFSNHFRRRLSEGSADIGRYRAKYFEILASLKPGGAFVYCPALPEIEKDVDPRKYEVDRRANGADPLLDTVKVVASGG